MKNLNTYINEGLGDWSDDKLNKKISKQTTKAAIKQEIIDWIVGHTNCRIYKNKLKFNLDTTPITIDYDGNVEFKYDIDSLTNGLFQWGEVGGNFNCSRCPSLKTLKGAPKEVDGSFYCRHCNSITSLEGSPEKVGDWFVCRNCPSLKSLEGAPKEVGGYFDCSNCGTKFSKDDVKKVSNVKERIFC